MLDMLDILKERLVESDKSVKSVTSYVGKFDFTDEDLQNEEIAKFCEMLEPVVEVEDTLETETVEEYPTQY